MDLCGEESGNYETNANQTRQVMNPDLLSSEALADANACEHTLASNQLYLEEAAVWNENGKNPKERDKRNRTREREKLEKREKTRNKREGQKWSGGRENRVARRCCRTDDVIAAEVTL
jgi:hypothetical protein